MQNIKLPIGLIMVLFALNLKAQNTGPVQLEQAFEQLHRLMEKPDAQGLATLAHPNLQYVHSSGTVRNKQGFVDEFMKGQTMVQNVKVLDRHLSLYKNTATIRYNLVAENTKVSPSQPMDIIILQVWVKEKNKWLLLARQAAKIPDEYAKKK
jgi:hypothetical protein